MTAYNFFARLRSSVILPRMNAQALIVQRMDEALAEGRDTSEAVGHVANLLGITRKTVLRIYLKEKA